MIWAWVIKNSIAIICWTLLAIFFGKWWIALFGLLFLSNLSTKVAGTCRICDKCGKHSSYAKNRQEALDRAKAEGWVHIEEGDRDYCSECKSKVI